LRKTRFSVLLIHITHGIFPVVVFDLNSIVAKSSPARASWTVLRLGSEPPGNYVVIVASFFVLICEVRGIGAELSTFLDAVLNAIAFA
jgi:hypothetical protein